MPLRLAAASAPGRPWRSLCLLRRRPARHADVGGDRGASGGRLSALLPTGHPHRSVRAGVRLPRVRSAFGGRRAEGARSAIGHAPLSPVDLPGVAGLLSAQRHRGAGGLVVAGLFAWGRFRPSLRQWGSRWCVLRSGYRSTSTCRCVRPVHVRVGQPDSLSGFFAYFSASDSYGTIAREASGTLTRVFELCRVLWQQTPPLLLWAGCWAALWSVGAGQRSRHAPLFLVGFGLLVAGLGRVVRDRRQRRHAWPISFPLLWALWWGWARLDPGSWSARENGSRVVRAACVVLPFVALGAAVVHLAAGRSVKCGPCASGSPISGVRRFLPTPAPGTF